MMPDSSSAAPKRKRVFCGWSLRGVDATRAKVSVNLVEASPCSRMPAHKSSMGSIVADPPVVGHRVVTVEVTKAGFGGQCEQAYHPLNELLLRDGLKHIALDAPGKKKDVAEETIRRERRREGGFVDRLGRNEHFPEKRVPIARAHLHRCAANQLHAVFGAIGRSEGEHAGEPLVGGVHQDMGEWRAAEVAFGARRNLFHGAGRYHRPRPRTKNSQARGDLLCAEE